MSRTIRDLMDLKGRVALVTGGGGHIGAEIVSALAELGATVAVSDRGGAVAFPADLSDEEAVKALPGRVAGKYGRLDILVNSAAFVGTTDLQGWAVPFEEQSPETWREALEVNLTSAFVLTQAAAPLLAASGRGSVVNIASIYGMTGPDMRIYEGTGMGNPAAYGASKGGVLQLTRWLSTVLAPKIRVNAVSPGGVLRGQAENFVREYEKRVPLGRMAVEEDIKGAVAYLACDLSAYVTGQNLVVDGGWTAW